MFFRIQVAIPCAAFVLSACATPEPVVVYDPSGGSKPRMRGTVTAGFDTVSFKVAGVVDGKHLTCTGSHSSLSFSPTISMPIECSDGRKGVVAVTRDLQTSTSAPGDGFGTVRMDDGTEAEFVYGNNAKGK
jgi:hypothetical protein